MPCLARGQTGHSGADGETASLDVAVLDGILEQYAPYVPE